MEEELKGLLVEVKTILSEINGVKLLTIKEAAKSLNIGEAKLRELTNLRDFPVTIIGSKRLIQMGKMGEWLYKHRHEVF